MTDKSFPSLSELWDPLTFLLPRAFTDLNIVELLWHSGFIYRKVYGFRASVSGTVMQSQCSGMY